MCVISRTFVIENFFVHKVTQFFHTVNIQSYLSPIYTVIMTLYLMTLAPTTTKVDFHGGGIHKKIQEEYKRKKTRLLSVQYQKLLMFMVV